jgi:protein-disulfide isomerase
MKHVIRTLAVPAIAALLAACSGGDNAANSTANTAGAVAAEKDYLFEDDYILGDVNAPVTLMEYASVACPACANWHATVYPEFREKYVETGKVNYVFRPFPTPPLQMADTGHLLAYCGKREDYFTNIKLQFDRQRQLIDMLQNDRGREAYISLAQASGLSEDEFISCLQNEDIRERYETVVQSGIDLGVTGTPTFFVNGEKVSGFLLEDLEKAILPALGETVSEPEADTDSAPAE